MSHEVRNANDAEIDTIARLWHDCWHDAHATLVPDRLSRLRSLESFFERTARYKTQTRVALMFGAVAGLCITKEDEIYQIYVAQTARGTGLAQSLMDDAEAGLLSKGVRRARLVCAIGNERAARFYRKCGWTMVRPQLESFETPDGPFLMEVWCFEKLLSRSGQTNGR
jgi:ribosomal protein S18 acetylase RimI-like enzyme